MIPSELIVALQQAFPLLSALSVGKKGYAGATAADIQPVVGDGYTNVSLQITANALSQADAVVKLQESNDGINWVDILEQHKRFLRIAHL